MHRRDDLSRNTAASSKRITRCRGGSRRSTSPSPPSRRPSRSCAGLKPRFEEHHGVKYTRGGADAAAELSTQASSTTVICRTRPSTSSTRRARRRRCCRRRKQKKAIGKTEIEEIIAKIARIPPRIGELRRPQRLQDLERDLKNVVFGQDPAIDALVVGHQAWRVPAWATREARSALPVLRSHGRRQDRGREAARVLPGRRVASASTCPNTWSACGLAADRRAAGLRRFRPGRPAHRGDHQASVRRAAARRDRKGAPGHLQHPAAGDGSRHADRQQRTQGGLPQRDHHHDHQRRRGRACEGTIGFTTERQAGDEMADIKRMFTPEFRNRLDAIDLLRGAGPRSHPAGGRQVPDATGRAVAREEGRSRRSPTTLKDYLAKKASTRRWARARWRG